MKKLMKKYGHVWILSYGLIYLPWFAALQQNVGKPYHVMHTALDDLIPFNEYFIVPSLLWFLYVAAAIAYFFFTNKDDYYRLCTFLFTGMTISLLVCTLYPNGTDFRPAINPDKNIFCLLPVDPFDSLLDFLIILIPRCAFQCLPVCNIQLMSTADSRPESHISNYHPQQNNNCCHNYKYYPHLSLSIYSLLTSKSDIRNSLSCCIRQIKPSFPRKPHQSI